DWIRERLADSRVLSYRVLYFERTDQGEWQAPGAYPKQAMAVVGTHDLPTLSGFWAAHDIEVRSQLGRYPDEAARRRVLEDRQRDKLRVSRALRAGVAAARIDRRVRSGAGHDRRALPSHPRLSRPDPVMDDAGEPRRRAGGDGTSQCTRHGHPVPQ